MLIEFATSDPKEAERRLRTAHRTHPGLTSPYKALTITELSPSLRGISQLGPLPCSK